MTRLSLVLLLAVAFVAGCDSTDPKDPPGSVDGLVGAWVMTTATADQRVTSRISQTVLNREGQPTGALSVSGDVTDQLSYVDYLSRGGSEGFSRFAVTSQDPAGATTMTSRFGLNEVPSKVNVEYFDAATQRRYSLTTTGVQSPLTLSGGRVTLPPVVIPGEGGGPSVTIEGTFTYPEIRLVPGASTVIGPQPTFGQLDVSPFTFTFKENGTFVGRRPAGNAEMVSGTWEATGDRQGRMVIDYGASFQSDFVYAYDANAQTLTVERVPGQSSCDAECLRNIEGIVFAERESLTATDVTVTYQLRRSGANLASSRVGR